MIISISGATGCGKTLCLTALAIKRWMQGYDIYANYHLYGIPFFYLEHPAQLKLIPKDMVPKFCALDELWLVSDSRTPTSKKNSVTNSILVRFRKRKADIGYTQQRSNQVDVRIRDNTHAISVPRKVGPYIYFGLYDRDSFDTIMTMKFIPQDMYKYYDTNEEPWIDLPEWKPDEYKPKRIKELLLDYKQNPALMEGRVR